MRFTRISAAALAFFTAAATLGVADCAWAQLRNLPAKGKRAVLNAYQNPFVILGNEQLRLAPGVLIYDTNNRTIVPVALRVPADVFFTIDQSGAVSRIYLLTPQEIQTLEQSRR